MKWDLKNPYPNIYCAEFEDHVVLAWSFLRFQEYYENRELAGKILTYPEYQFYYTKNGVFKYSELYVGFNIPSYIITYLNTYISDLNVFDQNILDIHNKIPQRKYYLIGIRKGDNNTKQHEFAHAFWYLDPTYKQAMIEALDKIPEKTKQLLLKYLYKNNYATHVWPDEMQAYLSTGTELDISYRIRKPFIKIFKDKLKELDART